MLITIFDIIFFSKIDIKQRSKVVIQIGAMAYISIAHNLFKWLVYDVLVVEETGVPGENHRPVASH